MREWKWVVDGHCGDIIMLKTAKTMVAYNGRDQVSEEDIETAAELALPHHVRRQPLQDIIVDVDEIRRRGRLSLRDAEKTVSGWALLKSAESPSTVRGV